ncbi:unnamed protein product [Paramecium primaurelia]|nr:unnamed protein product [Paramecium primaurelia]
MFNKGCHFWMIKDKVYLQIIKEIFISNIQLHINLKRLKQCYLIVKQGPSFKNHKMGKQVFNDYPKLKSRANQI